MCTELDCRFIFHIARSLITSSTVGFSSVRSFAASNRELISLGLPETAGVSSTIFSACGGGGTRITVPLSGGPGRGSWSPRVPRIFWLGKFSSCNVEGRGESWKLAGFLLNCLLGDTGRLPAGGDGGKIELGPRSGGERVQSCCPPPYWALIESGGGPWWYWAGDGRLLMLPADRGCCCCPLGAEA